MKIVSHVICYKSDCANIMVSSDVSYYCKFLSLAYFFVSTFTLVLALIDQHWKFFSVDAASFLALLRYR